MITSRCKFGLNVLFVLLLPFVTGCIPLLIGAAAGAGGITYARGALVTNVDHPVQDVHKAALKALKGMELFVLSDELNARRSVIRAEFKDGQSLKVFIDALTEQSSKLRIRVGTIGHQEKSRIILNAIQLHLK